MDTIATRDDYIFLFGTLLLITPFLIFLIISDTREKIERSINQPSFGLWKQRFIYNGSVTNNKSNFPDKEH